MPGNSKLGEFGRSMPRVVYAPAPFLPPSVSLPPNCVVSVVLDTGECVEWTWTTDPSGARYVTGFTISKPRRARGARKTGGLVVTRKSGEAILKQARTGKSTKALRQLMRDGD